MTAFAAALWALPAQVKGMISELKLGLYSTELRALHHTLPRDPNCRTKKGKCRVVFPAQERAYEFRSCDGRGGDDYDFAVTFGARRGAGCGVLQGGARREGSSPRGSAGRRGGIAAVRGMARSFGSVMSPRSMAT